MKFANLSFNYAVSLQDFVKFWSFFYTNPMETEHLYSERIEKQKFTPEDIEKLFEWKNGTRLSQKKQKSIKTITDNINIVNNLKNTFNTTIFEEKFKNMSAIWKIFLLHIIAPTIYPIFDQHVYRAFYFLTEGIIQEIPEKNSKKEKIYFEQYIPFFNDLAKNNIPNKNIDEALWAFGKFLKNKFAKEIVSPSPNTGYPRSELE